MHQQIVPAVLFQFSRNPKFWKCAVSALFMDIDIVISEPLFLNGTAKLQKKSI